MPVLRPDSPPSVTQRRVDRIALVLLSCSGIVFGVLQARNSAGIAFGYLAGYAYVAAVSLALLLAVIGLLLAIHWRTRWVGIGLIAAGLLSCVAFFASMAVLLKLDRVAWRHERLVFFGPNQKASLVIYFRQEVTEKQVEDFRSSVLAESSKTPSKFPTFVSAYLRLTPQQANGHWGVALTFRDAAPHDPLQSYVEKVKLDPRVAAVFVDIAPASIHATSESSKDSPSAR